VTSQQANFTARARVIDLLGREQIADAPTAISELLKNAIDAAAAVAEVRFFGDYNLIQIEDNGVGMRTSDLIDKWLVVATESKRGEPDQDWLRFASKDQSKALSSYPPLGEKGIGRLAVAALGNGVLVWTRWGLGADAQRTLLFVHWVLFQHPRLSLNDIVIPYTVIEKEAATKEDAIGLMLDMKTWIQKNKFLWETNDEIKIQKQILNDIEDSFKSALDKINFLSTAGTLFSILGTTSETAAIFEAEEIRGEEIIAPEGLKLLLGFCDPFTDRKPRLKVEIQKDGESLGEGLEFWNQEDFKKADHYINLTMNEAGFVTGTIRVYDQTHQYEFQVSRLSSRSRLPGPWELKLGYIMGEKKDSRLSADEHSRYNSRVNTYGGLYVYRDGIRVLPYGRTDQDFLEFERRRSLNAGRYFFSHRRMFGGLYVSTSANPELKDKAGREGFIKNAAYRGLVTTLTDVFIDLALTYYGREASKEDDKDEKEDDLAKRARERAKQALKLFSRDFAKWKRRLPLWQERLEAEGKEITERFEAAGEDITKVEQDLRTCYRLIEDARRNLGDALLELGTEVPAIVKLPRKTREEFDRYLTERQMLQQRNLKRISGFAAQYEQIALNFESERERINRIRSRIEEVRSEYERSVAMELKDLMSECQKLSNHTAVRWKNEQEDSLAKILLDNAGTNDPALIAADKTGESVRKMEEALALQQRNLREVYLPFWYSIQSSIKRIEDTDASERALGALNREFEVLEERDAIYASLAQLGLIVESIDHDYTDLYNKMKIDLTDIEQVIGDSEPAKVLVEHLKDKLAGLEERVRYLSPLYRRHMNSQEDLTGRKIRQFINHLFSFESEKGLSLNFSRKFLEVNLIDVNGPVVLAAIANIVSNAVYWTTQGSEPREIRFTIVPRGFNISDSGPGIALRDQERIFNPFFSRRPYGRGLGLYIAKTTLEASGLDLSLALEPQTNALSGANFIIQKRAN
jgi:signal transduction histidine kinase